MAKKLSNMTDAELAAEGDRLATERTKIRLEQLEVSREQEVRQALAALSPETRRIMQLGLEGGIKVDASREQEAQA